MALFLAGVALAAIVVFMATDLPRCDRCGTVWGVQHLRMNTMYHHDPSNWTDQCPSCMKDTDEYWRDMWADYYASVL